MSGRCLGQCVVVVAQDALLTAGEMRGRQLARQPSIPFGTTGKHQRVRSARVELLGAVATAEEQLQPRTPSAIGSLAASAKRTTP